MPATFRFLKSNRNLPMNCSRKFCLSPTITQAAISEFSFLWRASTASLLRSNQGDTAATPGQVREQVQAVDPTLPVFGAHTLNETVSGSLAERRFSMEMIGLFAITALLLAGLGFTGLFPTS
jgi:hypothetical protein